MTILTITIPDSELDHIAAALMKELPTVLTPEEIDTLTPPQIIRRLLIAWIKLRVRTNDQEQAASVARNNIPEANIT